MKLAVHQRLASMKPSWQCGWVSILQLELCQMKPSFPWRGSSCVLFRWQVYLCSIQWRALLSTRARRCSVGPEPKILQCGLLLRKALSPGSAESSQLCPDSASQELSHRKTWIYLEFRKSTDFKRKGGGGVEPHLCEAATTIKWKYSKNVCRIRAETPSAVSWGESN